MKNLFKVFGIIALAAVIGFSMASCKEPDDSSEPTLTGITAVYTGGSVAINTDVNSLKSNLTVTANYSGNTSKTLDAADYSLSGDLSASGQKTVTVTYEGKTTSFNVTVSATPIDITYTVARADGENGVTDTTGIVFTFSASVDSLNLTAADITIGGTASKGVAELSGTGTSRTLAITVNSAGTATVTIIKTGIEAGTKNLIVFKAGESAPVLTGITAVYNGTTAIYPTTPLNSLKAHLTVKAQYTGGGEYMLSEHEYSLSGTLTVGTSTVTVTYTDSDGVTKTTTFTVTVIDPTVGTQGLEYELISSGTNANTYRVRQGTVTGGAVIIPAVHNGLPVTEIGILDDSQGSYAFSNLNSIIIPASITAIGNYAFWYYNTNLTTVTFAENSQLKTIGDMAFYNCTSLANMTIPEGVTFIGNAAFSSCSNLASITLPVTTIGEDAFSGCNNIETVTFIDGSSTSIGNWFSGLSSITAVYIPASVTEIGGYAFRNCTGLTTITIPASVTSIGSDAFYNCTGLTSITLPVTTIGEGAFSGCNNIETVTFIDGPSTTIGDWFRGISSITTVNIPASVTTIGDYAFSDCTGLINVTIPASVTSIGNSAFQYCTGLTGVTIGAGVTSIGDSIFYGCTSLTTVTFIEGIESIGNWFAYCGSITAVYIPASVTEIGGYAFSGCTGLIGITLPEGLMSIGDYAFSTCTGLTEIAIPAGVTSIGSNAFSGCAGLTEITIPASVTSIGSYPFSGSGLTIVTFADGFSMSIGNWFLYNSVITTVNIPSSVTSIGYQAFIGCTGLTSITIPDSVTSIGNDAFYRCTGLTSITIPDSVTSIGSRAFGDWTNTQTINVNGYNSQAAADVAWGSGWRNSCNAVIVYAIVSEIEITQQPAWTLYKIGEQLNITGLVVTAHYNNNTTGTVTITAADITGFDSATAGVKTLTVTYRDKTATFTVTVMDLANDFFLVSNTTEWNAAITTISTGGNNQSYTVYIRGSVSVAGSTANTFGAASGLTVTLKGDTLTLSSNGNLLRIGANQTLIIDSAGLTLQGKSSNNNSLVYITNNAHLELKNGTIRGNQNSHYTTSLDSASIRGGGVYVDSGGNFTMSGGTISGNVAFIQNSINIAYAITFASGGGVYNAGTFTMTGGTISGNTARASGQYIESEYVGQGGGIFNAGTFRIVTGTVYGSNETDTSLINTVTGKPNDLRIAGAALYSATNTTAQRGTFSRETWVSSGALSTTENTISVVNGALQ
jgi:hypothetical protein